MKIVNLIQGTPDWHAHRAQHFNASDAPAMMGCSPYKSRAQLVRERATGVAPEIDPVTKRRFDAGHRFEDLARPVAESIIGEELYPCVGTDGRLSASFDGLNLAGDIAWEHKTLNDDLREAMAAGCTGADLPLHYQVQMEQQLMVSCAERVLFMASKWDGEALIEERHCWYTSNLELRAQIAAGWEQFEADVAAYALQPEEPAAPAAMGTAPEALPSLSVVARGVVEFSNHREFKERALAAIAAVNRNLQTDDDFATAELTVKAFRAGEDGLEAARAQILGQMASVSEVMETIDTVQAELRRVRLDLEKLVKTEKERRKADLVRRFMDEVRAHYDATNAGLGEYRMPVPAGLSSELAASIKGKKSLSSMSDALSATAAKIKIAAGLEAERIRACAAVIAEHAEHAALFPDRVQLVATKQPEDLRNLAKARVAEHQEREAARLEAERERIRAEEAAKLAVPAPAPAPVAAAPAPQSATAASVAPAVTTSATIKLGEINALIAPLAITADGLAQLGFQPVGTERAAKLYAADQVGPICLALIARLQAVAAEPRAAA